MALITWMAVGAAFDMECFRSQQRDAFPAASMTPLVQRCGLWSVGASGTEGRVQQENFRLCAAILAAGDGSARGRQPRKASLAEQGRWYLPATAAVRGRQPRSRCRWCSCGGRSNPGQYLER